MSSPGRAKLSTSAGIGIRLAGKREIAVAPRSFGQAADAYRDVSVISAVVTVPIVTAMALGDAEPAPFVEVTRST